MMSEKIKCLFIHNAVPEYRIEFWKLLGKKVELQLLITQKGLENEIYGLKKDSSGLRIDYWNNNWLSLVKKYDVVIVPPVETLHDWEIAYKVANECKKRKIPCIYWNERWEWNKKEIPVKRKLSYFAHRIMIKFVCKNVNQTIASGTKAKEYLEMLNCRRISVAYDSSTSPRVEVQSDFSQLYGIQKGEKIILYLGRIIEQKGLDILLRAYEELENKPWLLIVGEGEFEKQCGQYVKYHNLNKVIFIGKVQPNLRSEYYRQAHVFVMPSVLRKGRNDAWGLTINEALEQGTPVIATDVCGGAYDLLSEDSGIMVRNGSVEELYQALSYYLQKEKPVKTCMECYSKYSVMNMCKSFYQAIECCVYG